MLHNYKANNKELVLYCSNAANQLVQLLVLFISTSNNLSVPPFAKAEERFQTTDILNGR